MGLSYTDYLNELKLLDSDSEEEEAAETEGETKERDKKKTANRVESLESRQWREQLKSKSYREIKRLYYNRAVKVWRRHGVAVPAMNQLLEPRVFKDKQGAIVGFDTLEEYTDVHHPLWHKERSVWENLINYQVPRDELARYQVVFDCITFALLLKN